MVWCRTRRVKQSSVYSGVKMFMLNPLNTMSYSGVKMFMLNSLNTMWYGGVKLFMLNLLNTMSYSGVNMFMLNSLNTMSYGGVKMFMLNPLNTMSYSGVKMFLLKPLNTMSYFSLICWELWDKMQPTAFAFCSPCDAQARSLQLKVVSDGTMPSSMAWQVWKSPVGIFLYNVYHWSLSYTRPTNSCPPSWLAKQDWWHLYIHYSYGSKMNTRFIRFTCSVRVVTSILICLQFSEKMTPAAWAFFTHLPLNQGHLNGYQTCINGSPSSKCCAFTYQFWKESAHTYPGESLLHCWWSVLQSPVQENAHNTEIQRN